MIEAVFIQVVSVRGEGLRDVVKFFEDAINALVVDTFASPF